MRVSPSTLEMRTPSVLEAMHDAEEKHFELRQVLTILVVDNEWVHAKAAP